MSVPSGNPTSLMSLVPLGLAFLTFTGATGLAFLTSLVPPGPVFLTSLVPPGSVFLTSLCHRARVPDVTRATGLPHPYVTGAAEPRHPECHRCH